MKVLQLKPLTQSELPEALKLDHLCFGGLWTLEGYQRELESSNSDLLGLWISPTSSQPTKIAQTPIAEFRQQGLGQTMLIALLTYAVNRQLERATLEVRSSNHSAISLYQKYGFQPAGCRRRYYQDTGEDALILWKNGLHFSEFHTKLHNWQSQIQTHLTQKNWLINHSLFVT